MAFQVKIYVPFFLAVWPEELGTMCEDCFSIRNETKLRSEIVWHRFFVVPAFIRRFRSCIAVRKLFLKTSPNFYSRLHGSVCV